MFLRVAKLIIFSNPHKHSHQKSLGNTTGLLYLRHMKLCLLILCLLCGTTTDILDVAKSYLGVPYVAGTLESEGEERLIINEQKMDCTTFVELSVARWLAMHDDSLTIEQQVELMRYRKGRTDGYLSRLHYFTDWVEHNTNSGIWYELHPEAGSPLWHADTLTLNFMSEHPQSYPYLKEHAWAVDSMRHIEQRYAHYPIYYIGKEHLALTPDKLPIHNGDILALVTTIDGLDVTHLGFAVWKGNTLHLMHASMKQGKVIIDEQSLYEYLKGRKSCPGVRAIRLNGKQ